jgi:hypothetical protein
MMPGFTPTRRRVRFAGMVSRRRESAAVGVCVGGDFRWRGDLFGVDVGDWGREDEERERVMRARARVVEGVVVMVLSTLGLLGLAVVLRVLLL